MRMRSRALVAGALILAGACSDQDQPTAPNAQPESTPLQAGLQAASDDPIALARTVPGFGGFYLDSRGLPVVYLRDVAQRSRAEQALSPFFRAQGLTAGQLRVLPGKYDWTQLEGWFVRASEEVLAVSGGVFVDADEA